MYKILVVDDEPRIRKRICGILDWNELNMEIVGEAHDGHEALEMAIEKKPDIVITDICIPYLSGLELTEKLQQYLPETLVIIITGYDEFNYAFNAIKLKVFDFVLKPVIKEQFYTIVTKAKDKLDERIVSNKYLDWAKSTIKNDLSSAKERFFRDWLKGTLSNDEFFRQKDILGIRIIDNSVMFIVKPLEKFNIDLHPRNGEDQHLLYNIQSILEKLLKRRLHCITINDGDSIIIVAPVNPVNSMHDSDELEKEIREIVMESLEYSVMIVKKKVEEGYQAIPIIYLELKDKIRQEDNCSPIVKKIKEYINYHYFKSDFSLGDVCSEFKISRTYVWKLFKEELGISFIEMLTTVRINKAIYLMDDPYPKLYEIAEKVGFSSQHYFSLTFKKVVGVSPEDFRKQGKAKRSLAK
jgi:two-component system, response regulator YesN